MEMKMVYVSIERGDDKNNGLSGDKPVRTEAQAIKIAKREGITWIKICESGAIKKISAEAKKRAKKKR